MSSIEINNKAIVMFACLSLFILYIAYNSYAKDGNSSSPVVKQNDFDWKSVAFQDIPADIVDQAKSIKISERDINFDFNGQVCMNDRIFPFI